ncbi:hypothetical protein ABAC460_07610 [Asticcacaulis sp. AC460]|uniref:hypothetical protein n=1 Tax=Asticcacaulis sp. AC460 TaxID=1282360 RepID=UPI0003C3C1C3|nr:hypothetical protein [Asticcacaulis sp. AC460]ESQ90935.1 hypothetical protein ABAC460_07610 [Asticcacaulis sp. AC460]
MSSNRHALIVIGALLPGAAVVEMVETARAEGTQVVFVGAADGVTPRFPDWVIDNGEGDLFVGTNLAAQLRAVGVARLSVAGSDSVLAQAQALGFDAQTAETYA